MAEGVDLLVVGGGITGAGVFERACRLGLKTLLVEEGPPGGRTTSASSGLVHGGLRYLPYDVGTSAVLSREVGEIQELHPDLLRRQVFLWPVYRGHRFGLETVESLLEYYDLFVVARRARPHVRLAPHEALEIEPGLEPGGLAGAVVFDEWAVDPVALVGRLLEEGRRRGGSWRAFTRATALRRQGEGWEVELSGADQRGFERVRARAVVNATGPWSEETARLAGCRMVRLRLRRGSHVVLAPVPARHALLFPDARGRYVGLYPRNGEAWVGPTDELHAGGPRSAEATAEETGLLTGAVRRCLPAAGEPVRSVSAVRPIIRTLLPGPLSRDWRVYDHAEEGAEGLVTVTGGKLTCFRPMAEDACRAVFARVGRPEPARSRPGAGLPGLLEGRRGLSSLAASAALLALFWLRHWLGRLAGRRSGGLADFRRTYGGP